MVKTSKRKSPAKNGGRGGKKRSYAGMGKRKQSKESPYDEEEDSEDEESPRKVDAVFDLSSDSEEDDDDDDDSEDEVMKVDAVIDLSLDSDDDDGHLNEEQQGGQEEAGDDDEADVGNVEHWVPQNAFDSSRNGLLGLIAHKPDRSCVEDAFNIRRTAGRGLLRLIASGQVLCPPLRNMRNNVDDIDENFIRGIGEQVILNVAHLDLLLEGVAVDFVGPLCCIPFASPGEASIVQTSVSEAGWLYNVVTFDKEAYDKVYAAVCGTTIDGTQPLPYNVMLCCNSKRKRSDFDINSFFKDDADSVDEWDLTAKEKLAIWCTMSRFPMPYE